jgi:hypothetical protein
MDGEAVAKALTDGEMSMSRREADQVKILTIILTHNSPKQLHAFFGRMQDRAAEFFIRSRVLVLNQSDLAGLQEDYDRICRKYGAQHICKANRGASGGRFAAAELFHQSDADAMFYFEDDMLLWADESSRCRFGFPNQVRNLFDKAVRILESEALDYLKLSFHEVYADHSLNYYDATPARFDKLGSIDNEVGYFVGEVYYSNWPTLITRAGSMKLFFCPAVTEGEVVRRAVSLHRAGRLVTGVLAAFPISHTRIEDRPGRIDLAAMD